MPRRALHVKPVLTAMLLGVGLALVSCFAPAHEQGVLSLNQLVSMQEAQAQGEVYAPTVRYYKKMYVNTDDVKMKSDPRPNKKSTVISSAPVLKKGTFVNAEGKYGNSIYIRINGQIGWVPQSVLTELTELDAKVYLQQDTVLYSRMDDTSEGLVTLEAASVFYLDAQAGDWVYGVSSKGEGWIHKTAVADTPPAAKTASQEDISQGTAAEEPVVPQTEQPVAVPEKSVMEILTSPPLVYVIGGAFLLIALGCIAVIVRLLRR